MPILIPLAWGAAALSTGWAARQIADPLEETTDLAKWIAIGGAVYVSYRALKSAGAIK